MPQRTIKLTVRVVARAEQPSPDLAESSSATQRALAPAIEPARSDGARASESSIRSVQVFTLEPGEELEFAVEELASAGAQHDGASDGAEQHAASSKAEHVVWRSDGEAARHHAHFASFSHYHARGNTHESGGSVHTTDFDDTSEAACLQSLLAGPSRSHTTSAAHQTAIATSSSHRNRAPEHSRASSDLSWQELVSEMSAVALAEGIEGPTPLWQVNGGPAVARAPRIAYRSRTQLRANASSAAGGR
ncbi:hypothetical protein FA09DRAFT_362728 [Tilletiopsis washingtonensis]|uniref:Uncharacterized protein n=1 Tax=Tilletiopsis washingtonensis TaxID=58919 RepID=A0A316Z3N3_9BASI|nr:hypothetical protein FA09DRAFT_362728 [Tilletiopsis washingtonensis]PWN95684.1 hypothetical protein FA09DRAFT_362728 [Tilletiopsis washingtonensis]